VSAPEDHALLHDREVHAPTVLPDIDRAQVRVRARAVTQDRLRRGDGVGNALHAGIVAARRHQAAGAHLSQELDECSLDAAEITIDVEVVRLDRGDHRRRRLQREEGAVVLVGLHHVEITSAGAQAAAPRLHAAADHGRWVASRSLQDRRRRCRGCRLAVRAGHGQHRTPVHDAAQRLGSLEHRDATAPRRRNLGMTGRDRRCHDEGDDVIGVGRVVTFVDHRAVLPQRSAARPRPQVTAGDAATAAQQQLGQR
jgi:hypothetical protein